MRPLSTAPTYKPGDQLDADVVNAIVERVKREILGAESHGGPEGIIVARPRRPANIDYDGLYDVPLINTDASNAIQAYGVCETDMEDPYEPSIMPSTGRRGVTVRQYHFANGVDRYFPVPYFMVCGPYGISADSSNGFGDEESSGWGSTLALGGWVQASKFDEDDNPISSVEQSPNINVADVTWGPRPGSQCLWPYRSGFRLMTPPLDIWEDPAVDSSKIGYAYGYQTSVSRAPDAHAVGQFSGTTTSDSSWTAMNIAIDDAGRGFDGGLPLSARFDGTHLLIASGTMTPAINTTNVPNSVGGTTYLAKLTPYVDSAAVGDPLLVPMQQVKDNVPNLIQLSVPFSGCWIVNLKKGKQVQMACRLSDATNTTSAAFGSVGLPCHAVLHKVSDYDLKWQPGSLP
jgi:hypothetical protein